MHAKRVYRVLELQGGLLLARNMPLGIHARLLNSCGFGDGHFSRRPVVQWRDGPNLLSNVGGEQLQ